MQYSEITLLDSSGSIFPSNAISIFGVAQAGARKHAIITNNTFLEKTRIGFSLAPRHLVKNHNTGQTQHYPLLGLLRFPQCS
jgi:hypothetical protein